MACKAMEVGLALDLSYLRAFVPDALSVRHDSHQLNPIWSAPRRRNLLPGDFDRNGVGFWQTIGLHESAVVRSTFDPALYEAADPLGIGASQDPRLLTTLNECHRRRGDLANSLSSSRIVQDKCQW
jgi:hypothetical protein